MKEADMEKRLINTIPKNNRKEGVILIGRGPSVDTLHTIKLSEQKKYDTCTISDAIKLVQSPTYAFCYHYQAINRMATFLKNPKYLIMPTNIQERLKKRSWYHLINAIEELHNDYYFHGRNRKDMKIFSSGKFDINVTDKLFNRYGSVVGAVHFLVGYMGYKTIYYIGFDGGAQYGKLVHSNRKETKIKGAVRDYAESWRTIPELLKHYPINTFEPLKEFLKKP